LDRIQAVVSAGLVRVRKEFALQNSANATNPLVNP
jgi:hypothetical protein